MGFGPDDGDVSSVPPVRARTLASKLPWSWTLAEGQEATDLLYALAVENERLREAAELAVTACLPQRLDRVEQAIETMAWWLVQAQTGFGERDAQGISEILRGERT